MNDRAHRFTVNAITLVRFPIVLLFLVLAVVHAYVPPHEGYVAADFWAVGAAVLLIIASLTDMFDGKLARRWNVVSKFGAMADPLMDKIFYLVVFPTLLWLLCRQPGQDTHSLVMLVLTVIYILRDQWVTFLRSVASLYNAYCGAMWIGKLRTASTFPIAIFIYLWISLHPSFIPIWVVYVLEGFLIGITLWSILSYTKAYLPYVKKSLE